MSAPLVVQLAIRQLDAYNAADLDAFCACYHDDVSVLDADGAETVRGNTAFRERYRGKFEGGNFGASVDHRMSVGSHAVDSERYWFVDAEGARVEGDVLVRYTERDGTIAVVQFLR
jgi:hypothetical protein